MRKIVLSKRAENKLDKLLSYLQTEWSDKVKSGFLQKYKYGIGFINSPRWIFNFIAQPLFYGIILRGKISFFN